MPPKTGKGQGPLQPKKATLAAYKNNTPETPIVAAPPVAAPQAAAPVKKRKVGAPKKSDKERLGSPVIIHFTEAEKAMIQEKAGLVSMGRFLRHKLRNETDVFDK